MQPAAPSVPLRQPLPHRSPAAVVAMVLSKLGDRRYVRRVVLAQVPAHARQHAKGYFAGAKPPADARWAYIAAKRGSMVAAWEGALVAGALRDTLCANGGPPLVAWTVEGGSGGGFSDRYNPFEQRFPNPRPGAYRKRVALVGRRYGFTVVALRLLDPLQLAPLLIVKTSRPRSQFVADTPAILAALNPTNRQATTFEGFYFEARDTHGPFERTDNTRRGEVEGAQWSADPNDYPFTHG